MPTRSQQGGFCPCPPGTCAPGTNRNMNCANISDTSLGGELAYPPDSDELGLQTEDEEDEDHPIFDRNTLNEHRNLD